MGKGLSTPVLRFDTFSFIYLNRLICSSKTKRKIYVHRPSKKLITNSTNLLISGVIDHRLDFIFISNSIQEIISNVDILNAFWTDHSTVFCSSIKSLKYSKGPGFWKFNNSLISNDDPVEEIKFFIHKTKLFLEQNDCFQSK